MNSIQLSSKEKLEIIENSDKTQSNNVDIFDYFKTFSRETQTICEKIEKETQYENEENKIKTVNIGVGTKKIFMVNEIVQTKNQYDVGQEKKENKIYKKNSMNNQKYNLIESKAKNRYSSIMNTSHHSRSNSKNKKGWKDKGNKYYPSKIPY